MNRSQTQKQKEIERERRDREREGGMKWKSRRDHLKMSVSCVRN